MAYYPPQGYNPNPMPPPAQQPMYGQPGYPPQQQMAYPPQQMAYPQQQQQQMMPQQMIPQQPMGNVVPTQSFATLAFLGSVPGLLIRQKTDWLGAVLEVAAHANRYQLKPPPMGYNALSEPLDDRAFKSLPTYFMAAEKSECCDRMCCGPFRAFEMNITDATGRAVLRMMRPFKCPIVCGLVPCCAYYPCPQECTIATAEGFTLGIIRQSTRCFSCANYVDILDANENLMFVLSGYFFQFGPNCCCREYIFEILTPDLQPTGGKITNVFPGCNCRAMCTRSDNLEVLFPQGSTPEQRAAIVGSALFCDYLFFEKQGDNDNQVDGGDVASACLS